MEDIIKNLGDTRNYKSIQLSNGLKCLLISDKTIDVSSFCLSISVGAMEDPIEFQGLAHVLEHFLFTSSEKYPKDEEFSNFLLNNSGSINTGTDLDSASFCFECNSSVFEQGLERFVSYLTNPKFEASNLEKIMQTISSEFEINKENDYYRNFQILRSLSEKKSKFNKFGMGNKTTLKPGKNLIDSLADFFKTFYSANLMSVVVFAKEDLPALESLITKQLDPIPNINTPKPVYPISPFNENNSKRLIKAVSTSEVDEISLFWYFPFIKDTAFSKSLNYIWYILNFGGPNSLFMFLKAKGLVFDLTAKFSHFFENFTMFEVKLKLTAFGFQKTQEIVNIVFEYLEFIAQNGVSKETFEEAQKLAILGFNYYQKRIDFPFLTSLAKKLRTIPEKYILIEEYLWEKFDNEEISRYLNGMKLNNLLIVFNSKKFEKTDKFEPYYSTNYSCEGIPEDFIKKGCFINEFKQIPVNPFVPKSTKILPSLNPDYVRIPKRVYSSEQSDVFYRTDNRFKIPFCWARVRIFMGSIGMHASEKYNLYWQIWKDLIVEHLSETVAQILRAHGKFSINLEENAILLSFKGFSDTLFMMVQTIADDIGRCEFGDKVEKFNKICEGIRLENEKFIISDPWLITEHYLKVLLLNRGEFQKKELAEKGKKLDFQDFLDFTRKILPKSKNSWLIYGNIEEIQAVEIGQYFEKKLIKLHEIASDKDKICCMKLKEKTSSVFEYIIEKETIKNVNYSCLIAFWQFGKDTPKTRVLSYILTLLLSDPIYTAVSFTGKLGFSENGYELLKGVLGYKIKVISKNSCSQYLMQRVEEVLGKMKEIVCNIDEKKFEDLKNIVLMGITSENGDFDEEFENDWVQMSRNELDFNRDLKEKEALKEIKRKDIEEFFEESFLNKAKQLEIHVSNKYYQDQNIFQLDQRIKEGKTIIQVESIESFKKVLETFPVFY